MRIMLTELHRRIAAARYPIAVLTASDGGIYGRFGYGPATIRHELSVERGAVRFHADAPDPGGVRLVRPPTTATSSPRFMTVGGETRRVGCCARSRCGMSCWPTATTPAAAAQRGSRCSIPTVMPCIEYLAAIR